jgi:hypothetical protein
MKNYLKKIYFHHHLLVQNNFIWLVILFSSSFLVNYVNCSEYTSSNDDLVTNSAIKNNKNNQNNHMNDSFSLIYPTSNNNNTTGSFCSQFLFRCILLSVIFGTVILCTIIGNSFVIAAVVLERNLHNVANYLNVSLAFTDLTVAIMVNFLIIFI